MRDASFWALRQFHGVSYKRYCSYVRLVMEDNELKVGTGHHHQEKDDTCLLVLPISSLIAIVFSLKWQLHNCLFSASGVKRNLPGLKFEKILKQ